MGAIDLSFAQTIVESLMLDELIITEDPHDTRDLVIDPNTLVATSPVEPFTVYEGRGKCRPIFRTPPMSEGGQLHVVREYLVAIPIIDNILKAGQKVIFTSSQYDPGLVGQDMRIIEVQFKTFAVQRSFRCELRDIIRDR